MIDTKAFVETLVREGLDLWAGVPDSLLKELCSCASDTLGNKFLITANEGNAVGVACGWHVATGRSGVVYMQNSGEGNAVNPLLSIADPDVYGIPMLLVIGWRGEPGVHDEPQHVKQGKVTCGMLEAMGVPYEVLDPARWEAQLDGLLQTMREQSRPVALVVRKGTFSSYPFEVEVDDDELTREEALEVVLDLIGPDDLVVSTTGKESREVFEIREQRGETHDGDFLTVGGMGHTGSIAYGMALGCPERTVWCLDGDGSMLMHMGSLAVMAQAWPPNLRYVVNVNGAHESVGGQPNVGADMDVPMMLCGCGFAGVITARTVEEIVDGMEEIRDVAPVALVLRTRQGSRDDLGRPTVSPAQNKLDMMRRIGSAE
ncbi:MAG: phosphonopyruvate decarboxylase [Atopobiaceae bacterium]|nr:phosphonopyruvate decarboxylase [Atopobiaceae bacterium]